MPKVKCTVLCLLILSFFALKLHAQDSSRLEKMIAMPDKIFGALDKKTKNIEDKLSKQTDRYLSKLQKHEYKLKKKLSRKDSAMAAEVFGDIDKKYAELKNTKGQVDKYSQVYSGHLDSLTMAVSFLKDDQLPGLGTNPELQKTLAQYKELQSKLNASDQIRKYLIERQKLLKDQFEKLGMVKQVKQFRKQVYYYQAHLKEYKTLFEDPHKLEKKLMELVMKHPKFKEFFANNSMLGSLFAIPGSTNATSVSLAGLQTRAIVNQSLIDRFGSTAAVTSQLQQNMQSAQGQLNELKNKLSSFSSGNYGNESDENIPGFKPNVQKTKSFLQRLEYGANIQSQKARYFFPITSDLGLSLGYKLNDKSSIGVGASYKIGWGRGWNNISVSHQGVGLRSYIDWKIKGAFYLSGGYEQNYRNMINSVDQLRNFSSWQRSGLVGFSKKYKVSKKLKGEMKLIWDFLSYQQVPKAQPILFRIGYSLK